MVAVLSVHVRMSADVVTLVSMVFGMVWVTLVVFRGIDGGKLNVFFFFFFVVVARLWEEEFEAVGVSPVEVVAVQALGSNETEVAVQGEGTRICHLSFKNHLRMTWQGEQGSKRSRLSRKQPFCCRFLLNRNGSWNSEWNEWNEWIAKEIKKRNEKKGEEWLAEHTTQ